MTLDQLAAELNALEIQVDAALNYDVLSDALVWEDEIPPLQGRRPSTFWCMRALLHHRTCMILKSKRALIRNYGTMRGVCFRTGQGFLYHDVEVRGSWRKYTARRVADHCDGWNN